MELVLDIGEATSRRNYMRRFTLLAAFAAILSVGAILPNCAEAGCY